ncbi:MAG TPA: pyridoxamine 5'-phosphate oxidase [Myxococcales bacterium]|jgi:pyridoxamine 5'-phosphate oxidase|nr:pyridoxamine 5'-phosphate oxidase [Myxococcales bacterium]
MDPIAKFIQLLDLAKRTPGIFDATGMTLSTVSADGRPSARIVLLKGVDAEGLVFYTNTLSRKGREIAGRPDVALTFWWPQIESQVRFEGRAARVDDSEADAYFSSRLRVSQLGAWASQQSQPLRSREELEQRFAELEKKYEGKTVPRPAHWSGYRVPPLSVEFWWNRPGRLHDRELYTRSGPGAPWALTLLNP